MWAVREPSRSWKPLKKSLNLDVVVDVKTPLLISANGFAFLGAEEILLGYACWVSS
jgi:hypothetical protein